MRWGLFIIYIFCIQPAWSKPAPVVGNKAAADYFVQRSKNPKVRARRRQAKVKSTFSDHYLMLHIGGFLSDDSYNWGESGEEDVGVMSLGLSYRMKEWVDSTDFLLRIDFTSYNLRDSRPQKMSVMAVAAFPDVKSGFPLYFGLGGGAGVFFKQLEGESSISLDYQIFAGLRFFNIIEDMGIFLESGIKNHLHVLSDGQFNSTYLNAGTVFVF